MYTTESAKQISIEEYLSFKAQVYFRNLTLLQERKPNFFKKVTNPNHKDYRKFLKITDNHLNNISTTQLLEVCSDNQEVQSFLIQHVFLEKEDKVYRQNSSRKDPRANWSDKLISMIGRDGETILNGILNHLGDPVRTKDDTYSKAAEKSEIEAEHSLYLDRKPDSSLEKVMAEVADGIYNIEQLITLDPSNRKHYILFINTFSTIFKVKQATLISIVIAKYHHRMYCSKHAKNDYDNENQYVFNVIKDKFSHMLEEEIARKQIDKSFKLFNKMFPILDTLLKLNLQLFRLQQLVLEISASNK